MKQEKFNSHHTHTICISLNFLSHIVPFSPVKRKRLAPSRKIRHTKVRLCSHPLLKFFIPLTAEPLPDTKSWSRVTVGKIQEQRLRNLQVSILQTGQKDSSVQAPVIFNSFHALIEHAECNQGCRISLEIIFNLKTEEQAYPRYKC